VLAFAQAAFGDTNKLLEDSMVSTKANIDTHTVDGFGREWEAFDQTTLDDVERRQLFDGYFSVFPLAELGPQSEGFDLGCGSGRWAEGVAERGVRVLHCIDPSERALAVARRRLGGRSNVAFHQASSAEIPLADGSQDFGYSLGVLHHIPDTAAALSDCVRKLKPNAPFLIYLYYRFENRPSWFRALWAASDIGRRFISRMPFGLRNGTAGVLAVTVYYPLARFARAAERKGRDVSAYPLSFYRNSSFYTMRTDALDRFGTKLEHRFTRAEIKLMMENAGLVNVMFRDDEPFWVACGRKVG
jgi:SAM-dependent methyltransferase